MSKKNSNCNYSKKDRMERDYERKEQLKCLAKHLGLDYIRTRTSDIFLTVLLHITYITRSQAVSLGFSTENSINQFMAPLKKKGLINDFTYKQSNKQKVFTLSKKGFFRLELSLPERYLDKWGIKYREIRKAKGYIEHRLRTNDLFISLLSNPQIGTLKYMLEDEAYHSNKEERKNVVFHLDGRLLINNKIYWLEQDMGTESKNQLIDKFNRLKKACSGTEDLIITVSMENKSNNFDRKKLYKNLEEIELLSIIKDISKELILFEDIYDYIEKIKKMSSDTSLHKSVRQNYDIKFKVLNALCDRYTIKAKDDLQVIKRLLTKQLEDKKRDVINSEKERLFFKRQKVFYKALFENKEMNMDEMVYKGMNIYVLQNKHIPNFIHRDYFGHISLIEKVKENYETIYRTSLSGYKRNGMIGKGMDYVSLNNIYSGTVKLEDEEIEFEGQVVIEDYMYNLASRKRLQQAFDKLAYGTRIDIIVIVENIEMMNFINENYLNNKFNYPYTRVFFQLYHNVHEQGSNNFLVRYKNGSPKKLMKKW